MNHTEVLQEITEQIERAAVFAIPGTPASFMEFLPLPGEEDSKHAVYTVYGYTGKKAKKVMRRLGEDLAAALMELHPTPLCILWRRYPKLEESDRGWKCTVRLAVIDRNCNVQALNFPPVEEGESPPRMPE